LLLFLLRINNSRVFFFVSFLVLFNFFCEVVLQSKQRTDVGQTVANAAGPRNLPAAHVADGLFASDVSARRVTTSGLHRLLTEVGEPQPQAGAIAALDFAV
jgi:hypothetical protein